MVGHLQHILEAIGNVQDYLLWGQVLPFAHFTSDSVGPHAARDPCVTKNNGSGQEFHFFHIRLPALLVVAAFAISTSATGLCD